MAIDIKLIREELYMTQGELAIQLGISTAEINAYEHSPETLPLKLKINWLETLIDKAKEQNRTDIILKLVAELVDTTKSSIQSQPATKIQGINPGTPYAELHRLLNLLLQYIDDKAVSLDLSDLPNKPPTSNDLREKIKRYFQKPNLVITGGFDAGKSYMANTLLGKKVLPVSYQPATKVITFVRHIQDRPQWFKDRVLILGEDFWHRDDKGNPIIDLFLLDNQEQCQQNSLVAGGFEILEKYGVHSDEEEIEANSAVVYVDSPLLKACNLIDLPGFSDSPDEISKDTEKASSASQIADLIIYASPAKRHIESQDQIRLGNILSLLSAPENNWQEFPTLGNLFIVATQADPSISDYDLEKIIQSKALKRLYKFLEKRLQIRKELINREISQEDLRKRSFAFWSETPQRCLSLTNELTSILGELLPKAWTSRIDREVITLKNSISENYAEAIAGYENTIQNLELAQQQLKELEANEPLRYKEVCKRRNDVIDHIKQLNQNSAELFREYAQKLISVDFLEETIGNTYDNQKEAKEYAPGYVIERLQNGLENIIKDNSEKLIRTNEAFLEVYKEASLKLPTLNKDSVSIPFDVQRSFIAGMAGLGTIGALSAWAATLGNLGGYILVAKLVSLLSALGISIGGGTAAVIAFVATIGGPIVIGIGIAAAIAFGVWSLFGQSWQKRLAKELVSYFAKQQVVEKFIDGSNQFWEDTIKAFNQGADAVEADWKKYLEHLREISSPDTQSKERIEEIIEQLKALKDFFANVPWEVSG